MSTLADSLQFDIPPPTAEKTSKKDKKDKHGNKEKKDKKRKRPDGDLDASAPEPVVSIEAVSVDRLEKGEAGPGDAAEEEAEPEVEALSHKEQRKRRKLAKQLAASGDPAAFSTAPGTTTSNATAPKASGETIFTTSKQLLHFLASPECKVTRCHMPAGKKAGEHNRGFAYVDFDSQEGAEEAVKKSEGHLGGRKLLIKLASDFEGRPAPVAVVAGELEGEKGTLNKTARKILDRQKQPVGPTLFLGNLGFATTDETIKEMFEAHHRAASAWKPKSKKKRSKRTTKASNNDDTDSPSESDDDEEASSSEAESEEAQDSDGVEKPSAGIRRVRLGTFEDTGKCKGWAFVDFMNPTLATAALTNQRNHTLDGRSLVVEFASQDAVRRGGGLMNPTSRGGGAVAARGARRGRGRPMKSERAAAKAERYAPAATGGGDDTTSFTPATFESAPAPADSMEVDVGEVGEPKERVRKEKYKGRTKPGAALANAPRAKVGIVKGGEGMGKKVVFE